MIDLHCHVLSGIDDGPATIEGSVALARAAAAAGIETLVATPHVSARYRNDPATIRRLVDELNVRLAEEEVALEVLPGAEIEPAELSRLGLGAGPWLLMEPPFAPIVTGIESILGSLQREGYRVLLAHPERCPAFHRDPAMLESLVSSGVLTSITAGSLVGQFGSTVRRFALGLVRDGLVHNVASDAHDDLKRPPGIAAELERAGLAPLTDWLASAVPTAILNGEDSIPPPPDVALPRALQERGWLRRRMDGFRRAS
jgi:protein-tyrosine phosphatase